MNLTDHFNAFYLRSKEVELTANARSLYFAILGEFNSCGYPPQMNLPNTYLQYLSGINSTHSFDSSRKMLVSNGLINYKRPFYELTTNSKFIPGNSEENLKEKGGNSAESFVQDFENISAIPDSNLILSYRKDREKEKEKKARARKFPHILEMWEKYHGENLTSGQIYGLSVLESLHGTENFILTLKIASASNDYSQYPFMTYNYFKKVLDKLSKKYWKGGG